MTFFILWQVFCETSYLKAASLLHRACNGLSSSPQADSVLKTFPYSFSPFFEILNPISSRYICHYVHQVHELKDMPMDITNSTLVYMLNLEPLFHP